MSDQLKSPVSDAMLTPITVDHVELFKDPDSGGYWIRHDDLHNLTEKQQTTIEEVYTGEILQVHQGRICPDDATPLMEFEFEEHSGIKLDYCTTCHGIWLDEGELTNLLNYLNDYEFGEHLRHDQDDEHIGITDRVLLFLYQLTRRPPLY